ncbi:hypothetical protein DL96DRAFT_1715623 [Flagelloscypha sp. PMI_526]|nr:hypothetical protein DL96DRAFT_1715623 [Flagelloscypha sp. PMI_526]
MNSASHNVWCNCTASGCNKNTGIINGKTEKGKWVSRRTFYNHRKAEGAVDDDDDEDVLDFNIQRRARKPQSFPWSSDVSEPSPTDPGPVEPPPPIPHTQPSFGESSRRKGKEKPTPPPPIDLKGIGTMASLLVAWLRLHNGLSCSASEKLLRAIKLLLDSAFAQILDSLNDQGFASLPAIHCPVPSSMETVYRNHGLNPTITSVVCCPKCFTVYEDPVPEVCTAKRSSKARPCNTSLWKTKRRRGGEKSRPAMFFHTQPFESWLRVFLSRPSIEQQLIKAFQSNSVRPPLDSTATMTSIKDSPGWNRLDSFRSTPYMLTFSFAFDYINPLGNRIAGGYVNIIPISNIDCILLGKQASTGTFSMYCLDLPEDIRHLSINTYPLGLTPTGEVQTPYNLMHLLDRSVDEFVNLYENGITTPTTLYPQGVQSKSAVDPVIGDWGVRGKLGGYMSHSAIQFCTCCEESHKNSPKCIDGNGIRCLDQSHWILRTDAKTRRLAEEWTNLKTMAAKDEHSKLTGIRSTPFHRLPYWDAVMSLPIGFMHNSSGILLDMQRNCYGLGRSATKEASTSDIDEIVFPRDVAESASELSALTEEAEEARAKGNSSPILPPTRRRPARDGLSSDSDIDTPSSSPSRSLESDDHGISSTPAPSPPPSSSPPFRHASSEALSDRSSSVHSGSTVCRAPKASGSKHIDEADSDQDSSDADFQIPVVLNGRRFSFTRAEWELLCWAIRAIILPSHKGRPPSNIGEASHGKLKAEYLFTLFELIYPIILCHIFWRRGEDGQSQQLIDNLYYLVAAINILDCYAMDRNEADQYNEYLLAYRHTWHLLFPEVEDTPNLHLALHNTDFLKFWGPFATTLNEFSPERNNGVYQRISTNKAQDEIDLTMLRQTARKTLLDVKLEKSRDDPSLRSLCNLLQPQRSFSSLDRNLSQAELAEFLHKNDSLSPEEYTNITNYLRSQQTPFRTPNDRTSNEAPVIYPRAARLKRVPFEGRIEFHTHKSHPGQSGIVFRNPQNQEELLTGNIASIWQVPLGNSLRTFFLINVHKSLPEEDIRRGSPYLTRGRFNCRIVSSTPSDLFQLVEMSHIISHIGSLRFDDGFCGIKGRVLVVSWASFDKGRRAFRAFAYPVEPFSASTVMPSFSQSDDHQPSSNDEDSDEALPPGNSLKRKRKEPDSARKRARTNNLEEIESAPETSANNAPDNRGSEQGSRRRPGGRGSSRSRGVKGNRGRKGSRGTKANRGGNSQVRGNKN